VIAIPSIIVFGGGLFHMLNTLQSVQRQGKWNSVPGFLLNAFGGGETKPIMSGLDLILAAAVAWLLWRVYTDRMDWVEGAGWGYFAMLLTAGSLLPWYVAWMFPLVCLSRSQWLWRAAMVMTVIAAVMTVGTYLPSGPFS